jgi:TRAP-type C4-dicarboxylate transport system substrate-binding protein
VKIAVNAPNASIPLRYRHLRRNNCCTLTTIFTDQAATMKKLTLKDMTESEQREVKTELDKARKNLGRELTNAENNKTKDEVVARIMAAREKIEKATRAERKANRVKPSGETFSWSASISTRPPR